MTVAFGAICSLLQSIEIITTRRPRLPAKQEKSGIREIIANWFVNQRDNLDDPNTIGAAVLSALLPHRRKDRVYGLQPPLLAKKLKNLLAFNHGQLALFDGWKTGLHGDLGAYVERAMKPWDGTFTSKRAFSVEQIDQLLVQLAAGCRFSDEAIRKRRNWDVKTDKELKDILVRLESWEAKWLVRLILRDHCTVELDEKFVLEHYHFLLPELLMFHNDFDAVFNMLRGELSCYPAVPALSEQKSMRIEAAQKLSAIVGIKVGDRRSIKLGL
jgi:DNA ligase-4